MSKEKPCADCNWSPKGKKRPKQALTQHRKAAHGALTVAADGSGTHTTLQAAVDEATDGGTVQVESGTYTEQVDVAPLPIRIVAEPTNGFTVSVKGESLDIGADRWTQGTDWTQFFSNGQEVAAFPTAEVGEIIKQHA